MTRSPPRPSGTVPERPLRAGVIGVGSMGRNHARVYRELADVELVGVADANAQIAAEVAAEYGIQAHAPETLLDTVDVVSVAVPTHVHADVVADCIDAGVHALVEKPFVTDLDVGQTLADRARAAGVTLQIGHIERFNPAVQTLSNIVPDLDILAVDAHRLGPPVERDGRENVVLDLMIHDIDIVRSLLESEPTDVTASTTADGDYTSARCTFEDDVVGSFTASRVTQQKIRQLGITCRECRIIVDYIDQSVEIHRSATPSYVQEDGDLRHTTESVVERPLVESGEPLKAELASFVSAAKTGDQPVVTAEDGLRAVALCQEILATASGRRPEEAVQ